VEKTGGFPAGFQKNRHKKTGPVREPVFLWNERAPRRPSAQFFRAGAVQKSIPASEKRAFPAGTPPKKGDDLFS
jgi:hypothetical protein